MCTPIADPLALVVFRLVHATRVFAILAAFTALPTSGSELAIVASHTDRFVRTLPVFKPPTCLCGFALGTHQFDASFNPICLPSDLRVLLARNVRYTRRRFFRQLLLIARRHHAARRLPLKPGEHARVFVSRQTTSGARCFPETRCPRCRHLRNARERRRASRGSSRARAGRGWHRRARARARAPPPRRRTPSSRTATRAREVCRLSREKKGT